MTTGSSPEVIGRFHCTKKRLRQKADVAFDNCTCSLYEVYMRHVQSVHMACTVCTRGMYLLCSTRYLLDSAPFAGQGIITC
jgi:hypothetical protein